jgi:hypothetical protein
MTATAIQIRAFTYRVVMNFLGYNPQYIFLAEKRRV